MQPYKGGTPPLQRHSKFQRSKMIPGYNDCYSDGCTLPEDFAFQRPCQTPDDEAMEHLLSKPVTETHKPMMLTHKHIGEHNLDKTRSDGLWLHHKGSVYDVISLHRQLTEMVAINKGRLPEVCDIGDIINGDDDEDESISDILSTYDLMSAYIDPMERVSYNAIWKCLPSLDLSEEQIKQALEIAYVAHYKELSEEEFQAEFQQEVFLLRCDIQTKVLTPQLSLLLDILERSVVSTHIPHNLDRNLNQFFLPRGVYSEDLRSWLEVWVDFDTEVTEDVMARERCHDIILESEAEETFLNSLRPYDSEPEFDHTIEGEAAWNVLETDIIHGDQCTPQQLETFEARSHRKLSDQKMEQKRQTLANYFSSHYRKNCDISAWAEDMEKGWECFQALCEDAKL